MKKGTVTGLSGTSGSGKTTFLKIVTGLYDSKVSEISADGRTLIGISTGEIAYAALENGIFPMNIYDNITLGNTVISRDSINTYFTRLGFSDWISTLVDT